MAHIVLRRISCPNLCSILVVFSEPYVVTGPQMGRWFGQVVWTGGLGRWFGQVVWAGGLGR